MKKMFVVMEVKNSQTENWVMPISNCGTDLEWVKKSRVIYADSMEEHDWPDGIRIGEGHVKVCTFKGVSPCPEPETIKVTKDMKDTKSWFVEDTKNHEFHLEPEKYEWEEYEIKRDIYASDKQKIERCWLRKIVRREKP